LNLKGKEDMRNCLFDDERVRPVTMICFGAIPNILKRVKNDILRKESDLEIKIKS